MATSTWYDVNIRYALDDRASAGMERLSRNARDAHQHTTGLTDAIKGLGAAFAVGSIFHKGKELFVDFNREMQMMRISAAAMLQGNELAKTFDGAQRSAEKLVKEYQKFAVTSPNTTKEIFAFSNQISTAVAQAGGNVRDIVQVTEQGITAAKAFLGDHADIAGLQISEALQRGAHSREIFTKTLIQQQHMSLESFNKLDMHGRLGVLEKALNSDAIKAAAKAFGESYQGQLSTLEDRIQILGGKFGENLFNGLTKTMADINHWLEKNDQKVQAWGSALSRYLVEGFGMVKDAVGLLIQHKDLLLKIGEVWAISKIVGATGGSGRAQNWGGVGAGNVLGGAARGGALAMFGGADKLGTGMMAFEGALSVLPGQLGLVSSQLLLFHSALQKGADELDKQHVKMLRREESIVSIKDLDKRYSPGGAIYKGGLTERDAILLVMKAKEFGAFKKDASFADASFTGSMRRLGVDSDEETRLAVLTKKAFETLTWGKRAELLGLVNRKELGPEYDPDLDQRRKGQKSSVNVTIHKIEVASDDPDRFVFGLERGIKRMVHNPTQAYDGLRGL